MTAVAILSPGYPEKPGGVTDHTDRLVRHWEEFGVSVRVIGDLEATPDAVKGQFDQDAAQALLIQYVPFLYGRRGVSRYPEHLALICQSLGIRVTTFVHEPWVPPTRLPWLFLSPIHRRQLRRLLRLSDETVSAVPKWISQLGQNTKKLYVGSTLESTNDLALESTEEISTPVVFSPFASGLLWDWIGSAVEAMETPLTVVGCDSSTAAAHPAISKYQKESWDFLGRLDSSATLNTLRRAKLVFAPFIDGITGRRTSAMATLSVGSRLLTSKGHLFDEAFAEAPIGLANSRKDFVSKALNLWNETDSQNEREVRLQWFEQHLNAKMLDRRLLKILTGEDNPG